MTHSPLGNAWGLHTGTGKSRGVSSAGEGGREGPGSSRSPYRASQGYLCPRGPPRTWGGLGVVILHAGQCWRAGERGCEPGGWNLCAPPALGPSSTDSVSPQGMHPQSLGDLVPFLSSTRHGNPSPRHFRGPVERAREHCRNDAGGWGTPRRVDQGLRALKGSLALNHSPGAGRPRAPSVEPERSLRAR